MILSIIEKTKNDILLKCSIYNEKFINDEINKVIDSEIYVLAEDLSNLLFDLSISEEVIRKNISDEIRQKIIKRVRRKLFVDSLALQITNENYIEKFYNKKTTYEEIKADYIIEYNKNKDSNQLNLYEDINLEDVYIELDKYIEINIISLVKENELIVNEIKKATELSKIKVQNVIESKIKECDNSYLEILTEELKKNEERVINMEGKDFNFESENPAYKKEDSINVFEFPEEIKNERFDFSKILSEEKIEEKPINNFDQYDDMTLYNKVILSLNTKEEKLSREEEELKKEKNELDKKLDDVNQIIEKNLDKQELLGKLEMQLREKELEINNKLSEADVIFLNMMPLVRSLNEMKEKASGVSQENRGDSNE